MYHRPVFRVWEVPSSSKLALTRFASDPEILRGVGMYCTLMFCVGECLSAMRKICGIAEVLEVQSDLGLHCFLQSYFKRTSRRHIAYNI